MFLLPKHSHLETGEDRQTMYDQMYKLSEIDRDVKELESLVSSESFNKHRQLASLIPPELKRYRKLVARNGEANAYVKKFKPIADSIEKYIAMFKKLNRRMELLQDVLDGPKNYSAYVSPLSTPVPSAPASPKPVPMDLDERTQPAKRAGSPTGMYPDAPKRPRIPQYQQTLAMAMDQNEADEEATAVDLLSDEECSDIEEPTEDDLAFSNYASSSSPGLSRYMRDM